MWPGERSISIHLFFFPSVRDPAAYLVCDYRLIASSPPYNRVKLHEDSMEVFDDCVSAVCLSSFSSGDNSSVVDPSDD